MRYPRANMEHRVNSILNGTEKKTDLRYVIYSAHDTQIANLLEFFNFSEFFYDGVPYCS